MLHLQDAEICQTLSFPRVPQHMVLQLFAIPVLLKLLSQNKWQIIIQEAIFLHVVEIWKKLL